MSNKKIVRLAASEQIPTISKELQTAADTLQEIGWGVSVFGSARIKPDNKYYHLAEEIGRRLANAGYPVIAGGGPGIMEAANKGAFEAGGRSVGLNIELPRETTNNSYQTHSLQFQYFYSRKATFFMHSAAYIALPGGFGTLDEFFEAITLVQTGKNPPAPIILVGTEFWCGLIDWIKAHLSTNAFISPNDINLITMTDDVDTVMKMMSKCFSSLSAEESNAPAALPKEIFYT